VETSVWNFLLEEDRPDHRAETERFFQHVSSGESLYISEVVVREIERAPAQRRDALRRLVHQYAPTVLAISDETESLAQRHVQEGLIPPKYHDDALHLASAVVHELDVLVSWNFEHLVKLKTRVGVNGLNRLLGYPEIEIVSPEEVSD
jgi:predicted nucleic acid-binding protein